jgi:hypothetical protein
VTDAFGDDAGLSSAGAGNYQERPFAVGDGPPLGIIQLQAGVSQWLKVKEWQRFQVGFPRKG